MQIVLCKLPSSSQPQYSQSNAALIVWKERHSELMTVWGNNRIKACCQDKPNPWKKAQKQSLHSVGTTAYHQMRKKKKCYRSSGTIKGLRLLGISPRAGSCWYSKPGSREALFCIDPGSSKGSRSLWPFQLRARCAGQAQTRTELNWARCTAPASHSPGRCKTGVC